MRTAQLIVDSSSHPDEAYRAIAQFEEYPQYVEDISSITVRQDDPSALVAETTYSDWEVIFRNGPLAGRRSIITTPPTAASRSSSSRVTSRYSAADGWSSPARPGLGSVSRSHSTSGSPAWQGFSSRSPNVC
ncbi:Uncharacterised protein [Mycobacteroides abscessus]|nr:Uncharacterised protein [Mycobacteroides abscessus]